MKDNKYIFGVLLVFILFLTIGLTYAYFSIEINGNEEANIVQTSTGTLSLRYQDGPEVTAYDVIPSWTMTKTVSVTNNGSLDAYYKLYWKNLYNNFVQNELLVSATCVSYVYYGTENQEIDGTCASISEYPIPAYADTLIDNVGIKSGYTNVYLISISFIEKNSTQNYNQGKSFNGVLGVIESTGLLNVMGQVLSNGVPVANANISLHSNLIETTTDSNGKFYFENVEFGDHVVTIENGGNTIDENISILNSSSQNINNNVISTNISSGVLDLKINVDSSTINSFEINNSNSYTNSNSTTLSMDYADSLLTVENSERGYTPLLSIHIDDDIANCYNRIVNNLVDEVSISEKHKNNKNYMVNAYIPYYKDKDLDENFFYYFNKLLDVFRRYGKKIILRVSYTSQSGTDLDPTLSQALEHIESFKSVYAINKDIIYLTQVGFVGTWGEGHSTSLATSSNISAIIGKLLEVTPESMMVGVRTLTMYQNYTGNKERLTIYNDSFLGSETDVGSYENERAVDLATTAPIVKNKYYGGEAVIGDETQNDVNNSNYEMGLLNVNYLNPDWGGGGEYGIYEKWKSIIVPSSISTTYNTAQLSFEDYVENNLGYRFKFDSITIDQTPSNGYLNIAFTISNSGYASLINEKICYILLEKDGNVFENRVNVNLTKIKPGDSENYEIKMSLPNVTGEYNVYLEVTDMDNALKNNINYNIKLANKNVYNDNYGANYISTINIIEGGNSNKFIQVNSIVADEYAVSRIFSSTIDGIITDNNEWNDNFIKFQNDYSTLYLKNDDTYLYLFISTQTFTSSDIVITTNDGEYLVEDDTLYSGSYSGWSWNNMRDSTYVSETLSNAIEFKVLLSSLNISSADDLSQIFFYINYDEDLNGGFTYIGT